MSEKKAKKGTVIPNTHMTLKVGDFNLLFHVVSDKRLGTTTIELRVPTRALANLDLSKASEVILAAAHHGSWTRPSPSATITTKKGPKPS